MVSDRLQRDPRSAFYAVDERGIVRFRANTADDRDALIAAWNRRTDPALADALAEVARLLALVDDFLCDDDPCFHDHHGYCQAHGWMAVEPSCPHARARAALGGTHD